MLLCQIIISKQIVARNFFSYLHFRLKYFYNFPHQFKRQINKSINGFILFAPRSRSVCGVLPAFVELSVL